MTRKDPSYHPFSYIYFSDGQWHTKSFDETGQRVNNTGYSDVSFGTKDPFFFQVKLEEGFLSVSLRPEEKVQFYSIETGSVECKKLASYDSYYGRLVGRACYVFKT